MADLGYKTCCRCGETKALEEFRQDKNVRSGRTGSCKRCLNAEAKHWREENPEKRREYLEKLEKRFPGYKSKYARIQRERYPEKYRARKVVTSAVYTGSIEKPDSCEECRSVVDDSVALHAHHEDYSKPRDVIWLCRSCHRKRDSD